MQKNEIRVGKVYKAKVSGKITRVRVEKIREREVFGKLRTCYDVFNLATNRRTTFDSAAKFRGEYIDNGPELAKKVKEINDQLLKSPKKEGSIAERLASVLPEVPAKTIIVKEGEEPSEETKQFLKDCYDGPKKPDNMWSRAAKAPYVAPAEETEEITPVVAKREPTEEQKAIIAAAMLLPRVLVVYAGAGTGKTTSLRFLADTLKGNGQYIAFNKNLVTDSSEKFIGTKVSCNTTHSLAFRAIGKQYSHRLGGDRVRSDQIANLLGIKDLVVELDKETLDKPTTTKVLRAGFLAGQVMQALKRFCQSADKTIAETHFRYLDGIDKPKEDGSRSYDNNTKVREYLLPFAEKAWKDIVSTEGTLPFSHDCYVKIWELNKPVIAGSYILSDESQDVAPVMLSILQQQSIPTILVGDSAQQIYEWRGAVDAMAAFPNAPVCYLSQSFRFGPAVAEVANAVLESLDEPTELRLKGLPSIPSKVEALVETPDCILCRTNAVAVTKLLEAIANNVKVHLVGGGADVASFVRAAKDLQSSIPTSHPELACFANWVEVQEYSKLDEGEDLKLMVKLIDSFGCDNILNGLNKMVTEKEADLVICTAHKSKGREWDKVQLSADFPTRSKSTDSDKRLLYVAVTRAKKHLDVSGCPFFTGQDCLDISSVAAKYNGYVPTEETVTPPTPSVAPPAQFTWSKTNEGWAVRGPKGYVGKTVDVVRKDGSKSRRLLGEAIYENGTFTTYRV